MSRCRLLLLSAIAFSWDPALAGFKPSIGLPLDAIQPSQARAPAADEFVGPFPSWRRVTTDYGAAGDGVRDDTAAFQRALDEVGRGRSPVLFVPNGRYRITATLTLKYTLNVRVIGEDPAGVTILWDGPPSGTMLLVNGVAYSTFARLTFDGRGRASAAIEQSWDNTGGHFDTGNEYADLVLQGVDYGIRGGFKGHGFAEATITRSRFVRNAGAGVALGNFNALDVWIWSSTFEQCRVAVTNEPGAGNFRVYGNLFIGSTTADLFMQNTGLFSARDNYSIGSQAFFVSGDALNHPANVVIQRNTILDPKGTAIRLGNQGPGLLFDNVVRNLTGVGGPAVAWRSRSEADLVSVGNQFTVPRPLSSNGRLTSVEDRTVAASSIVAAPPDLPPTPPNYRREIIEVPAGADADAVQQAITAAAVKGRRAVVHLPFGSYDIAHTLTIPASDVQIVGDGFATILNWTGSGEGPVIRVQGPTTAMVRELQVEGGGRANGLEARGIDQPGARVLIDEVQMHHAGRTNLLVDGLREARVELIDSDHSDARQGPSLRLKGGRTTVFAGSSSNNLVSYEISDGADAVVRDSWYEGNLPGTYARIRGRADVTFENVRVAAPPGRGQLALDVADLDGRVALVGVHVDDRLALSGDTTRAELLALGLLREHQTTPLLSAPPGIRARVWNSRQRARTQGLLSPGSEEIADTGGLDEPFLLRLLARTRAVGLPDRSAPPPGVTDFRLIRVWLQNGSTNLIVAP